MSNATMTAKRFLLLAVTLSLMGGCSRPPGQLDDAGVSLPDAAPDGGPLRRLVPKRLFGSAPVENRVMDPNFGLIDASAWNPWNFYTGEQSVCTLTHQLTPLGQPALRLERAEDQSKATLLGMVKGTAGPFEVSVWLGRRENDPNDDHRARLLGLFMSLTGAVDLEEGYPPDRVTLDGVTWTRYVATGDEGPVAWATFRVENGSRDPLWISSPVLVPVHLTKARLSRARVRALTVEERADLWGHYRQFLDRF
jgi:hypothetical protein